jgi:hypothetical protein
MPRGPTPTTFRGRRQGGRELRTWVSAAEYARVEARAKEAGVDLGDFVRDLALRGALAKAPEWARSGGTGPRRLWAPTSSRVAVQVSMSGEDYTARIGTWDDVHECSSPMVLAGVLTLEGVQPPSVEDLEWVRSGT